jgi:hypothetical protein
MTRARKRHSKQPKNPPNPLPATRNRRLAAQTRKVMGKHYANKYRVG